MKYSLLPVTLAVGFAIFGLVAGAQAAPSNPQATPLTYNTGTGYYNPPGWNSMVMVNITFDGHGVSWEPDSYDFTVGPILHVAPSNGALAAFDPSQPWAVLNGTAFNRQLGWYDNVADDFNDIVHNPGALGLSQPAVPITDSVWIEQLPGSSTQLKTYFIAEADNPSGPYTPIFGTNGSSTKWLWDGFMDHNIYTVNLSDITQPNQLFTASYRVYIGFSDGTPDPNYNPSPNITWKWIGPATVPTPEPASLFVIAAAVPLLMRRRSQRRTAGI